METDDLQYITARALHALTGSPDWDDHAELAIKTAMGPEAAESPAALVARLDPAWVEQVLAQSAERKHASHDQSSHGSWARGGFRTVASVGDIDVVPGRVYHASTRKIEGDRLKTPGSDEIIASLMASGYTQEQAEEEGWRGEHVFAFGTPSDEYGQYVYEIEPLGDDPWGPDDVDNGGVTLKPDAHRITRRFLVDPTETKHDGPGPHSTGSPQAVHGGSLSRVVREMNWMMLTASNTVVEWAFPDLGQIEREKTKKALREKMEAGEVPIPDDVAERFKGWRAGVRDEDGEWKRTGLRAYGWVTTPDGEKVSLSSKYPSTTEDEDLRGLLTALGDAMREEGMKTEVVDRPDFLDNMSLMHSMEGGGTGTNNSRIEIDVTHPEVTPPFEIGDTQEETVANARAYLRTIPDHEEGAAVLPDGSLVDNIWIVGGPHGMGTSSRKNELPDGAVDLHNHPREEGKTSSFSINDLYGYSLKRPARAEIVSSDSIRALEFDWDEIDIEEYRSTQRAMRDAFTTLFANPQGKPEEWADRLRYRGGDAAVRIMQERVGGIRFMDDRDNPVAQDKDVLDALRSALDEKKHGEGQFHSTGTPQAIHGSWAERLGSLIGLPDEMIDRPAGGDDDGPGLHWDDPKANVVAEASGFLDQIILDLLPEPEYESFDARDLQDALDDESHPAHEQAVDVIWGLVNSEDGEIEDLGETWVNFEAFTEAVVDLDMAMLPSDEILEMSEEERREYRTEIGDLVDYVESARNDVVWSLPEHAQMDLPYADADSARRWVLNNNGTIEKATYDPHYYSAEHFLQSDSVARALKHEVASRLAKSLTEEQADALNEAYGSSGAMRAQNGPKYAAASAAVGAWAQSSNDEHAPSLLMQDNAAEHFGLHRYSTWEHSAESAQGAARIRQRGMEDVSIAQRTLLQAMYDATQEHFKEKGITHIRLHRGQKDWDGKDRPLSSWSVSDSTASNFSGYSPGGKNSIDHDEGPVDRIPDGSVIRSKTFPVEQILSCPGLGFGCFSESEFVVLANLPFSGPAFDPEDQLRLPGSDEWKHADHDQSTHGNWARRVLEPFQSTEVLELLFESLAPEEAKARVMSALASDLRERGITEDDAAHALLEVERAYFGDLPMTSDDPMEWFTSWVVQAWAGSATKMPFSSAMQRTAEQHWGLKAVDVPAPSGYDERTNRVLSALADAQYARTQQMLAERGIEEVTLYRGMEESPRGGRMHPLSSWSLSEYTAESFASPSGLIEDYVIVDDAADTYPPREGFAEEYAEWEAWNALNPQWSDDFDVSTPEGEMEFEEAYEVWMQDQPFDEEPTSAVVYRQNIPRERLMANPLTGFGSLGEMEFVVLSSVPTRNRWEQGAVQDTITEDGPEWKHADHDQQSHGNRFTGPTVHRGIVMPDGVFPTDEVNDLLSFALTEEEIGKDMGVGKVILDALAEGPEGMGLGRSWSHRKQVAETAHGPGVKVVLTAETREGDEDLGTHGGYNVSSEEEWTAYTGSKVRVTGVYLYDYYGATRGKNYLDEPVVMDAWRGPGVDEVKHADHDQSSHGNWARVGSVLTEGDVTDAGPEFLRDLWSTRRHGGTETSALLRAAGRVFGIEGAPPVWRVEGETDPDVQGTLDAFLQETYDDTQSYLASQGITEMMLYRGQDGWPNRDRDDDTAATFWPLSSWTTDRDIAVAASKKRWGAADPSNPVAEAVVPADRIFALHSNGMGNAEESEVIVLGGPMSGITFRGWGEVEQKHMGPGPHPSGTPQIVHAGPDTGGVGYAGTLAHLSDLLVSDDHRTRSIASNLWQPYSEGVEPHAMAHVNLSLDWLGDHAPLKAGPDVETTAARGRAYLRSLPTYDESDEAHEQGVTVLKDGSILDNAIHIGAARSIPTRVSDYRGKDVAIQMHNHPRDDTSLSLGDVQVGIHTKAPRIEAVTRSGEFVVEIDHDALEVGFGRKADSVALALKKFSKDAFHDGDLTEDQTRYGTGVAMIRVLMDSRPDAFSYTLTGDAKHVEGEMWPDEVLDEFLSAVRRDGPLS